MSAFDALVGIGPLREGLARHEPVVYRAGGFRATDGEALLARVEALLPQLGVTRVAELSQLAPHRFPVFQTSRPSIFAHTACGQNTGSQGKGRTVLQSKLSCLMEEVESYCCEPKGDWFVRGTQRALSRGHLTVHPRRLMHNDQGRRATATEPLGWAHALWLGHDDAVLVPAEAVYFPFFPEELATASFFPCSTNGLAAGATYLEAVIHGLYEVIERCYQAFYERGAAEVVRVPLASIDTGAATALDPAELSRAIDDTGLTLELLSITLREAPQNLPMFVCLLHGAGATYAGYGLSGNVALSVERAVSEALQAYAVDVSGSREDLEAKARAARAPLRDVEASTLDAVRARVLDQQHETLGRELEAVRSWLRDFGYGDVFVANLTRAGVGIPVVKVIVPRLPCTIETRAPRDEPARVPERVRFGYGLPADARVPAPPAPVVAAPRPPPSKPKAKKKRVKIYAGLSIDAAAVAAYLPDAIVAGPVARGDIARDLDAGVAVIGIVDGRFQQSLAVSIGELSDALRRGVRLYGSSSMGALRAAELDAHGMLGVGAIHAWLREQPYFRDDLLGQIFHESGPKSASVPFANLHFGVAALEADGTLDEAGARAIRDAYRALHFAERDRFNLLERLDAALHDAAKRALAWDQKRLDAEALCQAVATDLATLKSQGRALDRALKEARHFALFDAEAGMSMDL